MSAYRCPICNAEIWGLSDSCDGCKRAHIATPAQKAAAAALKSIFAVRPVLTFVCTKQRWSRDRARVVSQTAFVLAVDRGTIVNVSATVQVLLGLYFDPYAGNPAVRLRDWSPTKVARLLGLLLYLDEDKVRAEVIS